MQEDLPYLLGLYFLKGIGNVSARALIHHYGSAKEVFLASKKNGASIASIPAKVISLLNYEIVKDQVQHELKFIEKHNVRVLSCYDSDYPQRLKDCNDAPLLLFVKGNASMNGVHIVNIVGTRHASEYGKLATEQIVSGLASYNTTIVSGLALGIDGAAHRAALQYQLPTIAVLGHGFKQLYPPLHNSLAQNIEESGALITEYSSETIFDKSNFPKRNRIVAGMCDATIIVESAATGGAMITAELAYSYNRDIFAIPGRVHDNYSQGPNLLIKNLKAQMISDAQDIVKAMNWDSSQPKPSKNLPLFIDVNDEERPIVDFLHANPEAPIDVITQSLSLSSTHAARILLQLEMQGILRTLPGKRYLLTI